MASKNIIASYSLLFLIALVGGCGNPPVAEKRESQTIEWLKQMEIPSQYFSALPDVQTIVIGVKGTQVKIPRECFIYEDGNPVRDSIIITLKECYTPSDIIWNNLSTQTEHELLETGGMIYLDAHAGNKKLKIKEDKNIEIGFPRKKGAKEDMKLYEGDFKNGYINWNRIISDTIAKSPLPFDTIYETDGPSKREGVVYQQELDYYLFNTSMVGSWMNCDKMLEGEDKTILALNIDTTIIPNFRLVFTDMKRAAFPLHENGKMMFYNIPTGQSATLLGFYKEKEKYYMCKKDLTIARDMEETAQFKEVSSDKLKAEIESIKWPSSI